MVDQVLEFAGMQSGRTTLDREPVAIEHQLRYTDDTHMTLATARSLVACGGTFDGDHMAQTSGFLAMLRMHARTDAFAEALDRIELLPVDAPAADVRSLDSLWGPTIFSPGP